MMKPLILVALAATSCLGAPTNAGPFTVYNTHPRRPVSCHAGPGELYSVVRKYSLDDTVFLECQTAAEPMWRNNIWGKTTDGCWLPDHYTLTDTESSFSYAARVCDPEEIPGRPDFGAGPVIDDYPYRGEGNGKDTDPWDYYERQCVSFVSWRINDRHGIKFHARYGGENWGHADLWPRAARITGVPYDRTPRPGAIAMSKVGDDEREHSPYAHDDRGDPGRVAWVAAVNASILIIEEYDFGLKDDCYGYRYIDKSYFDWFFHFDDIL